MAKEHYPCVTYLDESAQNQFRVLQKDLFNLTGSKACLEEWEPHITVGKSLELDSKELLNLIKELKEFATKQNSFEVEIKDFGFMIHEVVAKLYNCEPYLVYLNVMVNDKLQQFVDSLNTILKKYECKFDIFPYKPHLTLAFKDLDEEGFEKAKKYLKEKKFSKKVKVGSFSLARDKEKNGKFREEIRFSFSS